MIRIFVSILLIIHAFIHLMGSLKEWNFSIARNFTIKPSIILSDLGPKGVGLIWFLCAVGIISSLLLFILRKRWWIVGAVSLIISQSLIILYWEHAKYGTLVNVVILIAIVLSYHKEKFNLLVKNEIDGLMNAQVIERQTTITLESLTYLPPVVQKWLVRSNIVGKEKIRTIRLKQKGLLRSKPEGKWMSMQAEQHIITEPAGFIWKAKIDPGYFMTINGRDKFEHGKGHMLIKAANMITVADSEGSQIDQGAMMRYLAEIMWSPTAALNKNIRWEYVNDTSARAVLVDGDKTVSGLFLFDRNGDVVGFEGKRYGDFNDLYSLETWAVEVKGYQDFHGVRIANKSEVTWKLKTGDFTWLKIEVTDIDFNFNASFETAQSTSIKFSDSNLNKGKLFFYAKSITGITG